MDRRTAIVSAASVVGVVLAGATAVGANIGILGQADNNGLGELSASGPVSATVEPEVIDVYLEPTPTPEAVRVAPEPVAASDKSDAPGTQPFIIEEAGVVEVETIAGGIRLGEVTASHGWTWSADQTDAAALVVTLESGDVTYVFTAQLSEDGSISASVEQPIVQITTTQAPAPPGPASAEYGADDDYEGEGEDHDEDDDHYEGEGDDHDEDEDEEDEHEGWDDDD